MAETTAKKKPPPKNWLIHEGCGGIFIFNKDALIPDERICQKCQRTETYVPDTVIIMGLKGTSEEKLREFCESLLNDFFKKPDAGRAKKSRTVFITRDKSNPQILAASIKIPEIEKHSSEAAEVFIRSCCSTDSYQKIVLAVCRKPVSLPTSFTDKKTKD